MNNKKFKILLVYPNQTLLGVVPGNIALLSACLKKAGFQVKLFDASIYRTSKATQDDLRTTLNQVKKTNIDDYVKYVNKNIVTDFQKNVKDYQPNLIAMTLVDDTVNLGLSLLNSVKNFNILKIIGGVAVTFGFEKLLKHDCVDIACIGEGEEAIVELCNRLRQHKNIKTIKNLYFKTKKGKITKNKLRPLTDINQLPFPDFSIFNDFRFYRPFHGQVVRMAPVDTDRGCPYSCTYCAAPNLRERYQIECTGNYFRTKNLGRVMDELKLLKRNYHINFIWFSSETFFARNVKELKFFADRYIKEIHLPFWCQTRLDTFTELKTKLLQKMGCQSVSVGLEHGNEQFRKEILKKFITNKQIIKSFKLLHKYNIPVTVNNIVGFPDETRKLVFDTVSLNRKITRYCPSGSTLNVFIFNPYSGTPLRKTCIDKGYIKAAQETTGGVYGNPTLLMPSMSREEISGLAKTLPLYIKLPKSLFSKIKIAEKNTPEGLKMFSRLSSLLS